MSAESVADAFVQHFYQTRDSNVQSLGGLFQPNSMLTFEGQQYQGPENIIQKLSGVGTVKHTVKTRDLQPTFSENALVIFVTGMVQIGGENPLHFSEMFVLVSTAPQQYYVHNSIFRLIYGQ